MNNKKRVSIDFDGTLTKPEVQEYVKELIVKGIDVYIVTARYNEMLKHRYLANCTNDDLYTVIENIGIPLKNVVFTNMTCKTLVLESSNVEFHLDDDELQLYEIHLKKSTHPISVLQENWKEQCETILNNINVN